MTIDQVLTAALQLPDDDRLTLAETLIASVDAAEGAPFDEARRAVIQRRSAELKSGTVAAVPWGEVKRRGREAAGG